MTTHPGWQLFVDRAHHTMAAKQRQLLTGRVGNIEEYKSVTGWLEGAEFVLSISDIVDKEVGNARDATA